MDVHPPKNGINRYWSIPISWRDSSGMKTWLQSRSLAALAMAIHPDSIRMAGPGGPVAIVAALDPWFPLVPLGLCEALGEVVIEHMGLRSWSRHRVRKRDPGTIEMTEPKKINWPSPLKRQKLRWPIWIYRTYNLENEWKTDPFDSSTLVTKTQSISGNSPTKTDRSCLGLNWTIRQGSPHVPPPNKACMVPIWVPGHDWRVLPEVCP
jgi:hypothetical protein